MNECIGDYQQTWYKDIKMNIFKVSSYAGEKMWSLSEIYRYIETIKTAISTKEELSVCVKSKVQVWSSAIVIFASDKGIVIFYITNLTILFLLLFWNSIKDLKMDKK